MRWAILATVILLAALGTFLLSSAKSVPSGAGSGTEIAPSDSGWVRFIQPIYGDTVNVEMNILPYPDNRYILTYQYRHLLGRRHFTIYVVLDSLGHELKTGHIPDPFHYSRLFPTKSSPYNWLVAGYIRNDIGFGLTPETFHATLMGIDFKPLKQYSFQEPSGYAVSMRALETDNGEWYVIGHCWSRSQGSMQPLLVKLNSDLQEVWRRTPALGVDGYGHFVVSAPGNDIYVAGKFRASAESDFHVWLARYSATGDQIWQSSINTSVSEYPCDIVSYDDGSGVIGIFRIDPVTLQLYSVLISFTPDGKFGKEIRIPSPEDLELSFIRKTADGQLLLLSRVTGIDGKIARLQKVSRSGKVFWTRDFLKGYWTVSGNLLVENDHILLMLYVNRQVDGKPFAAVAVVKTDLNGNLLDQSWVDHPVYEEFVN